MGSVERLSLTSEKTRTFEVQLVADLFEPISAAHPLAALVASSRLLVCTTPTVDALYGAWLRQLLAELGQSRPGWLVLDCTEPTKTMETVLRICAAAQEHELDRKSRLLAFGGGVCTDLVTMAASQIRRGISHVRIPTTLIDHVGSRQRVRLLHGGAQRAGAARWHRRRCPVPRPPYRSDR